MHSPIRLAWATDVHLDVAGRARAAEFCRAVREAGVAALLLGGDIADAPSLGGWLQWLADELPVPIHFVLGNHDYYGSDVASVRAAARALCSPRLVWLPAAGVVPLSDRAALVGHGGWGDARHGDFAGSPVILNDYVLVRDLRDAAGAGLGAADPLAAWERKTELAAVLGRLGDDAAATLRPHLLEALQRFEEVLVLTHVPPFREACWHEGRISNDHWLPGFTCKAVGDMLLEVVGRFPHRRVTVLCGHTHGEGEVRPLPQLLVRTGPARYGHPAFQVVEVAGGRA